MNDVKFSPLTFHAEGMIYVLSVGPAFYANFEDDTLFFDVSDPNGDDSEVKRKPGRGKWSFLAPSSILSPQSWRWWLWSARTFVGSKIFFPFLSAPPKWEEQVPRTRMRSA